jgi:hypothetical protein
VIGPSGPVQLAGARAAEAVYGRRSCCSAQMLPSAVAEGDERAPRLHVNVAGCTPCAMSCRRAASTSATTHLHALLRARRHLSDPGAEHGGARRPGRGQLHEPQPVVHLVIVVGVEADLLHVERLGAVDIGHRYRNHSIFQSIWHRISGRTVSRACPVPGLRIQTQRPPRGRVHDRVLASSLFDHESAALFGYGSATLGVDRASLRGQVSDGPRRPPGRSSSLRCGRSTWTPAPGRPRARSNGGKPCEMSAAVDHETEAR